MQNKKKRIYQPDEFSNDLKFKKEMTLLTEQVNEFSEKLKSLKQTLKKMESAYIADINKVHKMKKVGKKTKKESGFVAKRQVPTDLAKFIGVPENTMMSLPEYTGKFCDELKKRDLIYDKDKRVYRADKDVKKIFGFTDEINTSTSSKDKNGFNFSTLQKNINNAFTKHSTKKEKVLVAQA